ncbi:MAG: magnesium-translocating P-type ATPase [Arachidicoccus sp.]|nr:magnesium-translocating P-type ATPase [Arachidicoccus sp.]
MSLNTIQYWSIGEGQLMDNLSSSEDGLSKTQVEARLKEYNDVLIKSKKIPGWVSLFAGQFRSPIILILILSAILSFCLGDHVDGGIILIIILASSLLSFRQEKNASDALIKLLQAVQITASVWRDKKMEEVPVNDIVPGDIILLKAGDMVPGDCRLLASSDLFMDEAALTGETFPAEKKCGILGADCNLAARSNIVFMGTHVISGSAKGVVVQTGSQTVFGGISKRLKQNAPETEFEKGIRRFGFMLTQVTMLLVIIIFAVNIYFHKPLMDSLLFALAISVGLTPQLLPAIISINLSKGASNMAKQRVIVKRLSSIENFGSMNVLCSDKTGTLTEGIVSLYKAVDVLGNESLEVLRLAYLNACFETGYVNPIDKALLNISIKPDIDNIIKKDEVPYDFIRKRLSILTKSQNEETLITKGALDNVLSVCNYTTDKAGNTTDINEQREQLEQMYVTYSNQGFRVLGIAYKKQAAFGELKKEEERDMVFAGFLLFTDIPKADAASVLQALHQKGISLKIITGDNAVIAAQLYKQIGLGEPRVLTGIEMRNMSSNALINRAARTDIFAAVEPNQKEQIVLAIKKSGNVVGYLGDGINDASALHSADVGITVNTAVDIAKNAADIILLCKDLKVLVAGVVEGRKTFSNTVKYIFMATSANFGNMFSMAGASLFLPFLPLLPKQVLLTNLLTDIPEMGIATDAVDEEATKQPHSLNIKFIRKFMVVFGIISSVFDYFTFFVLLKILHAGTSEFRTGWFVESVISATLIVLVIRTSKVFYKSKPGKQLIGATLGIVAFTLILPWLPFAYLIGFTHLPFKFYPCLLAIIAAYFITAEIAKKTFYRYVYF